MSIDYINDIEESADPSKRALLIPGSTATNGTPARDIFIALGKDAHDEGLRSGADGFALDTSAR